MVEGGPVVLGRIGRAYAVREHSWSVVFDRLFAIYRDVTGW
jgi:hypothetical protein